MKTLKFLVLSFMALAIVSCGGKKVYEVTVDNTTIGGELSDYFSLVDKTYMYDTSNEYDDYVTVELKCEKPLPESYVCLAVVVLDNKGIVLSAEAPEYETFYDDDLLPKAKAGEIVTIQIKNSKIKNGKPAKIRLASKVNIEESETNSTETNSAKNALEVILPSSLKGKIEVASCGEVETDTYGYPYVEIGFKLLQTVNTSSMVSSYNQMWIVGVGQDKDGLNVKELLPNYGEWRTGDSDGKEFKEFLESEPGETINLTFTGGKAGNVYEGIKKIAKFKLTITND